LATFVLPFMNVYCFKVEANKLPQKACCALVTCLNKL
jgi:hypothetical protein